MPSSRVDSYIAKMATDSTPAATSGRSRDAMVHALSTQVFKGDVYVFIYIYMLFICLKGHIDNVPDQF